MEQYLPPSPSSWFRDMDEGGAFEGEQVVSILHFQQTVALISNPRVYGRRTMEDGPARVYSR